MKTILLIAFFISFLLTVFVNLVIVKILNGEGIKTSYFITDSHIIKFIRLIRRDKSKRNRRENLLILITATLLTILTVFLFYYSCK
jgi:hypothetical protein